ncbi:hypothetical protein [Deinococcus pimensis]|uniref:hypothetical protein n=1 Tax=Deinococcus pimensis TaxID=309888 RepID=UPI0004B6A87A|nr:hypothetical protein [Deinococcus pimensis]
MTTVQPQLVPQPARTRPNYWGGFLLTWFFQGAGHTYINRPGWHAGWIGIHFGLSVLNAILINALPPLAVVSVLAQLAAFILCLVQYRNFYVQQFTPGVPVIGINDGFKWTLIAVHLVLAALAPFGVLASILVPNMLSARNRAMAMGHQSYAQAIYAQAIAQGAITTLRDGPCENTLQELPDTPYYVRSCTVTVGNNPADPKVTVRFNDNTTINLP